MKLVEMTCPNCGGDLKKTSDTMAKCSHCGAEFEIDRGQPENVTNVYENTSQTKTIIVGILAAVLIGGFIAIAASSSKTKPFGGSSHTSGSQSGQTQIDHEIVYSRFFSDFTKAVFSKDPQSITEDELSSITSLDLSTSGSVVTVQYSINDGQFYRLLLTESDTPYWREDEFSQDLGRFTNLHTLCDYYTTPDENTLSKLENLTELRSDNSPEELSRSLPHPEKLTTLYCGNSSNPSLTGIETFTNLTELSISGYTDELSDISGLGALTHLKSLSLEAGEALTDFGVLQSLTELEELNLQAEKLKEISFLKSLTHLKKLTIKDAIMLDISPIGKLKELTDLCLEDNYKITDFKALSGLSGLKTLSIQLPTNVSMPSVKKWKHLTSLTVINVQDISFLSSLPQLRSLSLMSVNCSAHNALTSLHKLKELKLQNIYGNIPDLKFLNQMKQLESLDLSSLRLYGNVESIFSIPKLESLNISDCSFGMEFSRMPKNTSLKKLNMNNIELWKNIQVQYDGPITSMDCDDVNVDKEIAFLKKLPNLEELYIQGNKITNVEFVKYIPKLKKLDITNNYVTDLRPLESLQYLDTVWCGENSIAHGLNLGKNVLVVSDSTAEE